MMAIVVGIVMAIMVAIAVGIVAASERDTGQTSAGKYHQAVRKRFHPQFLSQMKLALKLSAPSPVFQAW